MSVELLAFQWNIGGGKIREVESDPLADASYNVDGLEAIIDTIDKHRPEVVTLQETHERDGHNQAQLIADALGYEFWVNDTYGESHIEDGNQLGQAILSRYPLSLHSFDLFIDPGYTAEWASRVHRKGVSSVMLDLGRKSVLQVQTLHAVPFGLFGVDPESEEGAPVVQDIEEKVLLSDFRPTLLQGDFNLNYQSLRPLMPRLFERGFDEIVQASATTPKGKSIDHILFQGLRSLGSSVVGSTLTDHFPVVSNFETF